MSNGSETSGQLGTGSTTNSRITPSLRSTGRRGKSLANRTASPTSQPQVAPWSASIPASIPLVPPSSPLPSSPSLSMPVSPSNSQLRSPASNVGSGSHPPFAPITSSSGSHPPLAPIPSVVPLASRPRVVTPTPTPLPPIASTSSPAHVVPPTFSPTPAHLSVMSPTPVHLRTGTPGAPVALPARSFLRPNPRVSLRRVAVPACLVLALAAFLVVGAGVLTHHHSPKAGVPPATMTVTARRVAATPTASPTATATPTTVVTKHPRPTRPYTYVARSGDTLGSIAAANNESLYRLEHDNSQIRDFDHIQPGQRLLVTPGAQTVPHDGKGRIEYVVQPNEYLSLIAGRYGESLGHLEDDNPLSNYNLVYPGQHITVVPGAQGGVVRPSVTSSSTPVVATGTQPTGGNGQVSMTQAIIAGYRAGFRGDALATEVAIMWAESGGANINSRPNADGSVDRGYMQLNSKAQAIFSDACAADLQCSENAAHAIYQGWGNTFKAWAAHENGSYWKFLGAARQAEVAAGL